VKASEVRRLLARHGLAPNRELGQSFLVDAALAARLVELAGVEPDDRVIEIGAGLGALTRALADRGARVWSLEVDAGLVRALRAEALLPAGVELIHADALEFDLESLVRRVGSPARVVANLPYSISAPALRRLLDLRSLLVDWSVMLQKEVALRVLASAGSRDYGSLAVLHHLTVDVTRTLELAPAHFHPPPKVRSLFLRMVPRAAGNVGEGELEAIERVVRAAFSKRRKTIANALRGPAGEALWSAARVRAALEESGIEAGERAERVPAERFLALARALARPEA
jgi:16S rRNA (adenine1518-N6/adenine1519-N6)-dimethyltransferase